MNYDRLLRWRWVELRGHPDTARDLTISYVLALVITWFPYCSFRQSLDKGPSAPAGRLDTILASSQSASEMD